MTRNSLLAALHRLPSMTPTAIRPIINHLSFESISKWTVSDLEQSGVESKRAAMIIHDLPHWHPERAAEDLQKSEAIILIESDSSYPAVLREIASPPAILYVQGDINALASTALAVVGTRRATPYGLGVTKDLVGQVAAAGITIVSGLALGIDAAAHRAALDAGGKTIAVIGTGIDRVYPWEHRDLAQQILNQGGAIISEFPLGAGPDRNHFPQRNRIISGLSLATLLVEAGEKSGALITAKFTLDQNRELLAIPGPLTSPESIGPNNWIRLGATLVRSAQDILEVFGQAPRPIPPLAPPTVREVTSGARRGGTNIAAAAPTQPTPRNPTEAELIKHLGLEPVHIDVLSEKSRLDTSAVSAALSLMEIAGTVRHHGGHYYSL